MKVSIQKQAYYSHCSHFEEHTNVHMGLGALESSSVRAHGINTIAALESLGKRGDSVALLVSSTRSAQERCESSGEGWHLDPSMWLKGGWRWESIFRTRTTTDTLGPTCLALNFLASLGLAGLAVT